MRPRLVAALLAVALPAHAQTDASVYPWPHPAGTQALVKRVEPPAGFARVALPPGGFGAWLRAVPVLPGLPAVMLFDGRPKTNLSAHALVLDIDVGTHDLQQCADAVMRLRAEYLWSSGAHERICFRFTSGDAAAWKDWREGARPTVQGSRVRWEHRAPARSDHETFRAYLDTVFTYAGSASLARELTTPPAQEAIQPGDVLIEPGFPGHAVLVLDVAIDPKGRRAFLLAQSYMPAQQIHVLRAPGSAVSPWYLDDPRGAVVTPEWRFPASAWRRFPERSCAPSGSAL